MCGTTKRTLTNKTRKDTQPKFYKVLAVPTLLRGCETWALNRRYKRKIEIAKMRFFRYVAGYTSELQIFNINDKITDKEKEWHDRFKRMDPYRIARINPQDIETSGAQREDDY
jgi:hypothetical protein